MTASFVRFALSPGTMLDPALECFTAHVDDLPLSHRLYASPRHWPGVCMAGALKRTADLRLWPRNMRGAVAAAVAAACDAHTSGKSRRAQAAAYAAARAALFAGDVNQMLVVRLARQLGTPFEGPLARSMVIGFKELTPRAAF